MNEFNITELEPELVGGTVQSQPVEAPQEPETAPIAQTPYFHLNSPK